MNKDEDPLELARRTIESLRQEERLHKEFINQCLEILPPSYDADEAGEAIILTFLKDMTDIARVIAKLTSDYR